MLENYAKILVLTEQVDDVQLLTSKLGPYVLEIERCWRKPLFEHNPSLRGFKCGLEDSTEDFPEIILNVDNTSLRCVHLLTRKPGCRCSVNVRRNKETKDP